MTTLYIVLGALALLLVWYVITWNGFIRSRNKVEEAWSGVDVQLKRRHDLVPNLVETVRGYAQHEQETLDRVTSARAAALSASSRAQRARAEAGLTSALGAINAVAEQYPQLRAAENFQRLQAQLTEVEDEIQASRRIYNANVQSYNTRIQIFPNSVIAGSAFPRREFFSLETPAERAVPKVAF